MFFIYTAVALGLIASISNSCLMEEIRAIQPFGAATILVGKILPFLLVIALSVERNAIYGTFAVEISALIWAYVTWLILLGPTEPP